MRTHAHFLLSIVVPLSEFHANSLLPSLQNEPPLELVLNAGEVRQYDVSFEPMGRAAQGTADSSASDTDGRARDPDQVQSPTNGAARDAADGREWVHERVDDVHEDTDGLMAELTRLAEDLNGEV